MWIVVGIVVPALFLVLFTPGVITLFAFKRMDPVCIPIFLGAGIVTTMWFEIYKAIRVAFLRRERTARDLHVAANGPVELDSKPAHSHSSSSSSSTKIDIDEDDE